MLESTMPDLLGNDVASYPWTEAWYNSRSHQRWILQARISPAFRLKSRYEQSGTQVLQERSVGIASITCLAHSNAENQSISFGFFPRLFDPRSNTKIKFKLIISGVKSREKKKKKEYTAMLARKHKPINANMKRSGFSAEPALIASGE